MLRTKLLFESFVANFNQEDVAEVLVVAPERDLPLLHSIVRSITDDRRYMLAPELEVCRISKRLSMYKPTEFWGVAPNN